MTRSDLLVQLVKAGVNNNQEVFRDLVHALIAEERAKEHHILAKELEENLRIVHFHPRALAHSAEDKSSVLVSTVTPTKRLADLRLSKKIESTIRKLVSEHHRRELLNSYALEPRNKVLLIGPPGNGKTSLAEALADSLMVPFLVVRYESVIGSYLGESANKIAKLFSYVRTRPCVLFFDEFDAIAKERTDNLETGEMKRIVSSLLKQIDEVPSYVTVVAATNHGELLDRAVWRRFQIHLELRPPSTEDVLAVIDSFEDRLQISVNSKLIKTIAGHFANTSYSELEEFFLNVQRTWVLSIPNGNVNKIIATCLSELLEQKNNAEEL